MLKYPYRWLETNVLSAKTNLLLFLKEVFSSEISQPQPVMFSSWLVKKEKLFCHRQEYSFNYFEITLVNWLIFTCEARIWKMLRSH